MKWIENKALRERYAEIRHPSGLTILVCPKEGYRSTYAIFSTRYGSIDNAFRVSGEEEFTVIPDGIAHFLEHKLFENENEDAFARYAKTGANANAYTSFDRTGYLFSCTENFEASLEILLDFVQSPYFTPETVEKEQGIIGQEIRMYDDEPGWRVMFNLLGALYHHHPVRIDIAGTCESIAKITADTLYRCYRTFYNLNNMVLAVAGCVTPEQVLSVCDRMLKPSPPVEIERHFEPEPDSIVTDRVEQRLSVSVPMFTLGFKEPMKSSETLPAGRRAEYDILLELIAGKTSPLYRQLLDAGLINDSFGLELFDGPGYTALMFSGESSDPDKAAAAIRAEVRRMREQGIDLEAFEQVRREAYGREAMSFDSVESIASALTNGYFTGCGIYDTLAALEQTTAESVSELLQTGLRDDRCALSIILPAECGE